MSADIASLRQTLEEQARAAAALAAEAMVGGWQMPPQPVHVEAPRDRPDQRPMARLKARARLVVLDR